MASPQLQNIIQMIKARPSREGVPIEETRAEFEQLAAAFPVADDVKREKAGPDGVPGEWFTPPGVSGDITVYWLHGGGYYMGSVNTHARMVSLIAAAADARAFAVDYRLAPENPFPAGLDDALRLPLAPGAGRRPGTARHRWRLRRRRTGPRYAPAPARGRRPVACRNRAPFAVDRSRVHRRIDQDAPSGRSDDRPDRRAEDGPQLPP